MSRLHVIYRSHGGENLKHRPSYYSKQLALSSFLRARARMTEPAGVLFLNDGPIPAERLELMPGAGTVLPVECGSNRRSYQLMLGLAAEQSWPDDDVVWFAEDDYLYTPDALQSLALATRALPDGDYFSLFSPYDLAAGRSSGAVSIAGVGWFRGTSTTSTFGVRLGALRRDRRLLTVLPYSGGSWDHTSCLVVQGRRPYRSETIRGELLPFGSHPPREWARPLVRGVLHAGMNGLAFRRPANRRTFYATDPLLVWHMETGPHDSPIWADVAADARAWASSVGITVPAPWSARAAGPVRR